MPRETIGTIICPLLGDVAEVREDKNGKLYYSGAAGIITPRTIDGQNWIRKHANLDGDDLKLSESNIEDSQLDDRQQTARPKSLLEQLWGADDE
ncbi:hypothetical protein [Vibrio diazotrophicus]|uniref:hypothetical protein n=1 Tax=Vibrio diazotrophicus TaxID=685 RepID=UPI003D2F6332